MRMKRGLRFCTERQSTTKRKPAEPAHGRARPAARGFALSGSPRGRQASRAHKLVLSSHPGNRLLVGITYSIPAQLRAGVSRTAKNRACQLLENCKPAPTCRVRLAVRAAAGVLPVAVPQVEGRLLEQGKSKKGMQERKENYARPACTGRQAFFTEGMNHPRAEPDAAALRNPNPAIAAGQI